MNICYCCHSKIIKQLNWSTFITGKYNDILCDLCLRQLEKIHEPYCNKCFKATKNKMCSDCKKWDDYFNGKDPLIKNISTFYYNDFLKEVIAKWKYRGDYVLGMIFENEVKRTFNNYFKMIEKNAIIVPIPLSKERTLERRFNQAQQIAEMITNDKNKIVHLFERIHNEKQAKKSRKERIFTKNPFKLRKTTNNFVILVDDIYTTGTTIRHAASLLTKNGCPAVYSYTLVRG